jgi:hypothetical protein
MGDEVVLGAEVNAIACHMVNLGIGERCMFSAVERPMLLGN